MEADSALAPYQFGELLQDVQNHDATRSLANRTGAKATGPAVVGSPSYHYVLTGAIYHGEANKIWQSFIDRAGVGRIKTICEAERWRFDAETLRMMRGRLCESLGVEPSAVDAMGLEQFANVFSASVRACERLAGLCGIDEAEANAKTPTEPPRYVSLDQMAAVVNRSKRTLEKLKTNGKLPAPDVKGGGGKPDEWHWHKVRSILETEYGKRLSERFPSLQKPLIDTDRH